MVTELYERIQEGLQEKQKEDRCRKFSWREESRLRAISYPVEFTGQERQYL